MQLKSLAAVVLAVFTCTSFTGCDDAGPASPTSPDQSPPAQQTQAPQNPAPAPQNEEERKRQSIIGKTTAEVVDSQKALAKNPNLKVLERRKLGDDPLTQAGNAYVYIRSNVSTLGMQQAIKFYQAEHGENPDYDNFMRMMRENRIEFTELYRWQKYGYDAQLGEIQVLQDNAEKERIYKEAGLDPPQD